SLAHQIFNDTRMTPSKQRIHALHFRIKPVVSLIADWDNRRYTAWSLPNEFRQLLNLFVAGDVFRIPNSTICPGLDHAFIHIGACNAQWAEKIALSALVHA